MSLDQAAVVAKLRSLTHKFDVGMKEAKPFYPELCTIVPSDGADEEYGLLGSVPAVREWIGDRNFKDVRAAKFTIENKEFEASLAIKRTHIEDDRLGLYGPLMKRLGMRAMRHPDKLLFTLINGAESLPCFDGQSFFDTDHEWGDSGSQSNDLTFDATSHTAVTSTEFRDAYHLAREAMVSFKDDQGELLVEPIVEGNSKLLVLVNPRLEKVAKEALYAPLVGGGNTNVVIDPPRIVSSALYTATTKFDLYNLADPLLPYIFQPRRKLMRQMKGWEDRENKDVKFMADARYNVGFGAWWNAVRTTFN